MSKFKHGHYINKKSGKKYRTLKGRDSDGLINGKNRVTGKFEKSVLYTCDGEDDMFCRELEYFKQRFELTQEYVKVGCFEEQISED